MIQELETKLLRAMQESDVATLNNLLSSELIYTTPEGNILSKEEDLAHYTSGLLKIDSLNATEREVFEFDENYIVSGKVEVSGEYSNRPITGTYRFTRVWTKNLLGHYQIICANSSEVLN